MGQHTDSSGRCLVRIVSKVSFVALSMETVIHAITFISFRLSGRVVDRSFGSMALTLAMWLSSRAVILVSKGRF